jgi:hypothetical protein
MKDFDLLDRVIEIPQYLVSCIFNVGFILHLVVLGPMSTRQSNNVLYSILNSPDEEKRKEGIGNWERNKQTDLLHMSITVRSDSGPL